MKGLVILFLESAMPVSQMRAATGICFFDNKKIKWNDYNEQTEKRHIKSCL